jgi:hypothetical protein
MGLYIIENWELFCSNALETDFLSITATPHPHPQIPLFPERGPKLLFLTLNRLKIMNQ